jgi:MYXO-CTERM domain-containing protein
VNDATFSDYVGGGPTNGTSYRAQIGRWLGLAPVRPTVYTAVRDAYDRDYPPADIGSGSLLLSWALLAEHEPKLCAPFFYVADWDDQGEVREATAYGANLQAIPHELTTPCMVPVEHDAPRATVVGQYDGETYHPVARWAASAAMGIKHVPYDPAWPFVYAKDGVLFQLEDAFVAGNGIVVHEPAELVPPTIESAPPTEAALDMALDHVPVAAGDEPRWWSLVDGPALARIDPATGVIAWTPTEPGTYTFVMRLDNRVGADEQSFMIEVTDGASLDTTAGASTDENGDTIDGDSESGTDSQGMPGTATDDGDTSGAARGDGDDAGCSCRASAEPRNIFVLLAFMGALRRRRSW